MARGDHGVERFAPAGSAAGEESIEGEGAGIDARGDQGRHVTDGGADDVQGSALSLAALARRHITFQGIWSYKPADWNMWRRSQVSSRSRASGDTASWSAAVHITSRIRAATPAVRRSVSVSGSFTGRPENEKPSSTGCDSSRFWRACSAIAGALARPPLTRRSTNVDVSSRYAWSSAGGAWMGSTTGAGQRHTRRSLTRPSRTNNFETRSTTVP